MFRTNRWVVFALAATLLAPSAVLAQQARLAVKLDPSLNVPACDFSANVGLQTAYVTVENAFPFQTVSFKAPAPCGVLVVDTPSSYTLTGDIATGLTVDLGACTTAPVVVCQIVFLVQVPASGCTWDILPADGDSDILLTDCNGNAMIGAMARSLYCEDANTFIAPYLPSPADGATNVPTNTPLGFTGAANYLFMQADSPVGLGNSEICGAAPAQTMCSNPFDPGELAPGTTYYWRAANFCTYCPHGEGAVSQIWSFTTGSGPVAVEQSTWGRVKALYRD
jgi:hypothetical protein